MKRRIISLALALVMLCAMLPITTAQAELVAVTPQVVSLAKQQVGGSWPRELCLGYIASLFNQAYGFAGNIYSSCCAYQNGNRYIDSTERTNIPLGACVYFGGSSVSCSCGNKAGHIGVYVGNDQIIHSWDGVIVCTTIDHVVYWGYPYRGYGWYADYPLQQTVESKPSKSESAGFISRCDGLWLWPTSYYTISDWAGCNASPSVNSKCQFCGTQHGTCGLEHATALGHSGIDILINAGSQVYAAAPGTLYCTNTDWENRGITAVVEHPISGTGYSYYSVYQQLSSTVVEKNGKAVKAGDVIAATGNTNGFGTGYAHLHFEILMGTKGQGKALAEAPNTKITAIENCGWITANKYATGLIVTNPALNSPAGTPVYTYGCESNVRAHAGSVMYTRNAADVSIGNAQEKPAVTYNTADVVAMSGTYSVTVSGANIWSKPYSSGDSKLVRTAAKGADLTVTGKVTNSAGSLWYKLSDGNWVYSSNVTKKVIKDTTTYREIDVVPCSGIYAISSNGANIWSKPFSSGSSKVVATYKKGTQLAIVAKVVNSAGSTWVQLSEGGWVYFGNVTRKTAITYNPENVVTVSGTYTVTSWGANVWSNPFTVGSTKVVRSVSKNAALAVTGRVVNSAGDTWYELSDGNWIFSGNVTRKSAITYNTANMVNYKASFKVISWGANLWSKPYSSGDSKVVRTAAKDATLSVVAKVTNSAGDIWYKLSDGCWVYGKNVTRK